MSQLVTIRCKDRKVAQQDLDQLEADFRKALKDALESGQKIPVNDEGSEVVHRMFVESYKRVMAGKPEGEITISVFIEK